MYPRLFSISYAFGRARWDTVEVFTVSSPPRNMYSGRYVPGRVVEQQQLIGHDRLKQLKHYAT